MLDGWFLSAVINKGMNKVLSVDNTAKAETNSFRVL